MTGEKQDEILDRNVESLLTRVHEPPRMGDLARRRTLDELKARKPTGSTATATAGPRQPGVLTVLVALAAILAVVWAGALFGRTGPGSGTGKLHANHAVAPLQVELPDGSKVLLRGGAEIREIGRREIRLVKGEMLIDVTESDAPFVVHTEHGRAIALGTRFSLREEEEQTLADVVRGTVRLESRAGEALLKAGEQGLLVEHEAPHKTFGERLSHTLAWARDALADLEGPKHGPIRHGNLIARDPRWAGEWPLPIRKLVVDVHVEDGIARTTIDQTFFNHIGRQLEGVYSFPLPSDAAISRLAMYVDGKLMEGGIVERQRGRNVYESIVYQRRDPALLEWVKGNEFRVRIFPLPPRTEKRVILSYTQELQSLYGAYRLKVPIPEVDLPVGEVEYRVHVVDDGLDIASDSHPLEVNGKTATYRGKQVTIGDDLLLTLDGEAARSSRARSFHDGQNEYLMVRAYPTFTTPMQHVARSWVVLYDTSASRSPQELEAQAMLLRRFLYEMDEDDRVAIVASDSETRPMPGGFARVRDLDPALLDEFLTTQSRMAAGVTNLALGLDAAVELLAGEQNAPHILYLGDGSVTEGTNDLELLRRRVANEATFVGVAVGDGVDKHALDALAVATGGLAVELSPGEDLAWRAFEVISMLNSPRVLDVKATLLDATGDALEVDALASSHTIPHGEGISVLARGDGVGEGQVKAIRLEGVLAGDAWSQTIELPVPTGGARYLPRLWARARIAAWLEQDAESHREQITKLGLDHFLITPFTSLLVLENEKMYDQFEVSRPDAQGWAHYDAPAEIEVVKEPAGADIFALEPTGDELILRDPVQILQWPSLQLTWDMGGVVQPFGTIGLGGLGLIGTGRGGGGTGFGTIGFGGGGGTGSGYGRGAGAGFGSWVADDLDNQAAAIDATAEAREESTILSTDELLNRQVDWKRATTTVTGSLSKSTKTASSSPRRRASRRFAEHGRVSGWWQGGLRTRSPGYFGYYGYGAPGVPYPAAFNYATDPRLDDLTNFVPAMFADSYDHAREAMLAANADRKIGRISEEARSLVDAARDAVDTARYQLDDGTRLSIQEAGRFSIEKTTPEGLAERIVYDGEHAYALYEELGLAIRRRIGPTSPLLLATWTPWVMPPAEHLARWYDVELAGPRTLRLSPPKAEAGNIEIELDEASRIVAVRRGQDETRFEHGQDGITIVHGDDRTRLRRLGPAATPSPMDEARWTVVTLPLRRGSHWEAVLSEHTAGSAAWRNAQRQRLASAAALGEQQRIVAAARELTKHVDTLSRGELVLLSGGVRGMSKKDLAAVVATADADEPVLAYLETAHAQSRTWGARPFQLLAKRRTQGLLGTLAAYRAALANVDRGRAATQQRNIEAFIEAHGDSPLAYVLVQRAAQYMSWNRSRQAAALWERLAERAKWRVLALYSAGAAHTYRGRTDESADLFERSIQAALDAGQAPIIDWQVRQALQSARGNASFQLVWSRWRRAAIASDGLDLRVAFVASAQQIGETDDIHRIVTTTKPEHLTDVPFAVALVDQLLASGQNDDAWLLVRQLLDGEAKEDSAVLDRAAIVSEAQGRIADAAGYLEEAMRAEAEDGIPLDSLRADYRRLIGLHARLAQSQLGAEEATLHREQALRVASLWRREDPDNPEIDRLCAALYVDEPDQAWRHLSSIIERHPAEGSAYEQVAQALEREGQLGQADSIWRRATEVEPTNPTWQLRRAENLAALGHETTARELLDAIVKGDWQDRFSAVVHQARQLRGHLER